MARVKTKKMTMTEYCDLCGRSIQSVSRDVRLGRDLKGVVKMDKIGRTHIFFVDISTDFQ